VNKNLKEFWDEICLPENQDIRGYLFRLDYTHLEKDTDGDNRFEEIQEELQYAEENDENFIKTRQGWKFSYIVKNADWLFVTGGETYGVLFDDAMVNRDTEFDAYYMNIDLWNYPFWMDEDKTRDELVKENLNWCPDFEDILNKYFKICEKHRLNLSIGKTESSSLSYEKFDVLVYKDFKGE
jgi:hypothetical protein